MTETRLRQGYFSVDAYRNVTRDERYWKRLAEMTPEEKVRWADVTRDMVLILREAYDKWTKTTP